MLCGIRISKNGGLWYFNSQIPSSARISGQRVPDNPNRKFRVKRQAYKGPFVQICSPSHRKLQSLTQRERERERERDRRLSMAETHKKQASATPPISPTTSNSATIGVPATAYAQTSLPCSKTIDKKGLSSEPYENPRKIRNLAELSEELSSELDESCTLFRKLHVVYEKSIGTFQSPETLDKEVEEALDAILDFLDRRTKLIEEKRQSVDKVLKYVQIHGLIYVAEDGLPLDKDNALLPMSKEIEVIDMEWGHVVGKIKSIAAKVKERRPDSISELLQAEHSLCQTIKNHDLSISGNDCKFREISSRVDNRQIVSDW